MHQIPRPGPPGPPLITQVGRSTTGPGDGADGEPPRHLRSVDAQVRYVERAMRDVALGALVLIGLIATGMSPRVWLPAITVAGAVYLRRLWRRYRPAALIIGSVVAVLMVAVGVAGHLVAGGGSEPTPIDPPAVPTVYEASELVSVL